MDARNNIAQDLFYKIRSRFSGLKLGAETGELTINPDEARFFDFDYMEGENPIGHVSISLAEPNSMKVYFSHGITEGMDASQKNNWYGFLKELRQFAKRRLLNFDTRDIAKDNLDKRDYMFLSQNAQSKQTPNTIQKPVGESIMSESQMYGSRTMSYQKLMDTRLIIKHNQAVMDDAAPGARSRHISALFVENQEGERFKYPFIHLAGARAMQRHVANGGLPYDEIGKSIIGMSEQIAQLKSFSNYVVRNDLMNSDTNNIVERSMQALNGLREQVKALSKQGHYEAYKENFQAQQPLEVPQEVVEDFTEKFTVRNFKEDIKSVFPVLYRLMQENNTLGYDDIVAMTQEEIQNEEVEREQDERDPFDQFESWVMALGEESAIQSSNEEEQKIAIQKLQELVGQEFPAGVDGSNAIQSLEGIIEDPKLFQEIKQASKDDPEVDLRGVIQNWLNLYAPEVLEQLDFGDFEQEIEDPMAYANAAADADAVAYGQKESAIGEASRYDEYEFEEVSFTPQIYWDENGKLTKVIQDGIDLLPGMDPEDVKELEYEIQAGEYEEQGAEPEIFLDVTVEYDFEPGESGEWERGGGQISPDIPDWYDPVGAYLMNGPQKVEVTDLVNMEKIGERLNDILRDSVEQPEDNEEKPEQVQEKMNVQELAEFIKSFYDRDSGTFPKGPEGVCTMVGKKFGEQAEQVARKFVERMAPQQTTEQNPELQELARIKQLSGM